jgi:hypothetical protein
VCVAGALISYILIHRLVRVCGARRVVRALWLYPGSPCGPGCRTDGGLSRGQGVVAAAGRCAVLCGAVR